jgi:hypothetical protein
MQKEGVVFPKEQKETVKWKSLLEYKSLDGQFGTQLRESVRNLSGLYLPNISSGSPVRQRGSEHYIK